MKIGSITCNWNGERFIRPHLNMLSQGVDRMIVLQGTAPWDDYVREQGVSVQPDRSEEIIRTEFPQVEIYTASQNKFGADLYNQGLEILSDCDLVLRLDYDMFLTKKEFNIFLDMLANGISDCYRINFSTRTINYYYDCDHGVKNAKEFDPIAVSPRGRFRGLLSYDYGLTEIITDAPWTIHHMRGFKGAANSIDWIEGRKTDVEFTAQEVREKYGNNGKWYIAPDEIKEMLI